MNSIQFDKLIEAGYRMFGDSHCGGTISHSVIDQFVCAYTRQLPDNAKLSRKTVDTMWRDFEKSIVDENNEIREEMREYD